MPSRKVLWVINVPDLNALLQRAQQCGATAICVRTSATNFDSIIPMFKLNGIDVLGWRYPPTDALSAHQQAVDVATIVKLGLDGFIVDPEGAASGSSFNWDQDGLDAVAQDYCATIREANPSMLFGTTSHYMAAGPFPTLPWKTFLGYSDAVYPQAYWRAQSQHGPLSIGRGPATNYNNSLTAWTAVGASLGNIFPMAGELGVASPGEIQDYANAAAGNGITELHFYVEDDTVDASVWQAIAQI